MTERVAEKINKSKMNKFVSRVPFVASRKSPRNPENPTRNENENKRSSSLPDLARGRVISGTSKRSSIASQPISDVRSRDRSTQDVVMNEQFGDQSSNVNKA